MADSLTVSLPFPPKVLWPNGRTRSVGYKLRVAADARHDAHVEADKLPRPVSLTAPIPVHLTVYPKSKGPFPDADNCVAACKALIDGLCDSLDLNDRDFAAPTVAFGPREARIEITLGPIQKEQET